MSERGDVWPKAACGHSLAHVHWDGCWKCEFERRHGAQDEVTAAEKRIKELEAEIVALRLDWKDEHDAAKALHERIADLRIRLEAQTSWSQSLSEELLRVRAENRALRKVMADAQPRLGFLYHRLINSYGEHPSVDYLIHARVVLDALKTFGDVDSKGTDAGCNPVPSGQPGASPGVSISDSAAQHVPLNGPQNPVSGVGPQGAEKVAAGSDLAPTEKCAECGHARRWHVEGRLGIPGFNGCGHSVKTSLLDSTACECWPFRPAASPPELWRGTIADAKGPDFPSADEVRAKIDEVGDWRKRGTDLLAAPPREPKPMVDSLGSTINHEPRPSREPREAERGRFCGVYGCGETHGCSTFTQHCWVCGCPADDIDGQSHYGGCARLDDAAASPQVEGAKEFILRAAFEALVQRWRKEAHSYVHRDRPDYEYARCEALNECAESLSRLLGGGE